MLYKLQNINIVHFDHLSNSSTQCTGTIVKYITGAKRKKQETMCKGSNKKSRINSCVMGAYIFYKFLLSFQQKITKLKK